MLENIQEPTLTSRPHRIYGDYVVVSCIHILFPSYNLILFPVELSLASRFMFDLDSIQLLNLGGLRIRNRLSRIDFPTDTEGDSLR